MQTNWSTWLGACIALLGNIIINLGTNLVVVYHSNAEEADPGTKQEDRGRNNVRVWRAGVSCFVLGNCLNFVSMSFAAQSLLAALGSVQFVSHVVFQWLVHGRPVSGRMCVATVLIFIGNSVIVAFGDHTGRVWSAKELENMLFRRTFLLYLIGLACVVAVAWVLNYYATSASLARHEDPLHIGTGVLSRLGPFCHTIVSAGIGSQSVTLAKCISLLLRKTVEGNNQFFHPVTHVLLFLWALTMAFWMHRLNVSLRKYDSAFIVPVLQVMWTFFSVLGGGVYFGEFSSFNVYQSVLFACGLCCVFSGVATLSGQSSAEDAEDDVEMGSLSSQKRNSEASKLLRTPPTQALSPRSAANNLQVEIVDTRRHSPFLNGCLDDSSVDELILNPGGGEHSDMSELEQEEMGLLGAVQHVHEDDEADVREGHVDWPPKLPDLEPHIPLPLRTSSAHI